jgi:hypothetical protein
MKFSINLFVFVAMATSIVFASQSPLTNRNIYGPKPTQGYPYFPKGTPQIKSPIQQPK